MLVCVNPNQPHKKAKKPIKTCQHQAVAIWEKISLSVYKLIKWWCGPKSAKQHLPSDENICPSPNRSALLPLYLTQFSKMRWSGLGLSRGYVLFAASWSALPSSRSARQWRGWLPWLIEPRLVILICTTSANRTNCDNVDARERERQSAESTKETERMLSFSSRGDDICKTHI